MITINIPGNPISVNHMYGGIGRRFLTKAGRAAKESSAWEARRQYKGELITTPLSVEITFYFADNRRRDVDNWIKVILDPLTGIVWGDDSQITDLLVHKRKDVKAWTEVIIIT